MVWENVRSLRDGAPAESERQTGSSAPDQYRYCLFVSGSTARSQQSIKVVRTVFDKYVGGNYTFAVIDVINNPEQALSERVYVTPTLIRYGPPPARRFVGDFTSESILAAKMELAG